ncbi:cytochrome c family protein [Rhodopseudomonas palustris]|nr:cytochrome c family protein [Rhodopseudomonas palustris]MCP9626511.1 cytochrome c family protein [Rhodopseudomonas palustris]
MKGPWRLVFAGVTVASGAMAQPGDAVRGQQDFRACAACHSLEQERNMTGPSLADLWGRKAGGLASFERYSDALKSSGIVWDDKTLDEWLTDPQQLVPDNLMPFDGIKDAKVRADLLAFLKETTKPSAVPKQSAQMPMKGMGGTGGMMAGGQDPNLKKIAPDRQVKTITYCHDTYRVTTADGKTRPFWERNLRFKTDSGKDGPEAGAPAIMSAGMMGDRASVIFAAPDEIARTIESRC